VDIVTIPSRFQDHPELCASLFVVAYGAQKDLAAADAAVARFHTLLDG